MGALISVGLGGAAGAMGRYLISLLPVKSDFPVLTLLTNLLGAVLIGLIVGIAASKGSRSHWLLFWKTGVCGGFTTFSTFSLEAMGLLQNKMYLLGGLYIALSVCLCILGAAAGQLLACRWLNG